MPHESPDLRFDVPHSARVWNYWRGTPLWRPAHTDLGAAEQIDSFCAVGRKP